MAKNFKKAAIVSLFLIIVAMSGYFIFVKKQIEKADHISNGSVENENQENKESKAFTFDSFHGSSDISDKFKFQYPANWHNDGQYFSPVKVEYYNQFTVKAPIYFDLVLSEIFHLTELQYQIDNSKRRSPDAAGQIDGREFKKYDLVDYGSYGGDSAGRVKIFVGPKIKIGGADYTLVFYWEENPLAEYVQGNSIEVFDNMLLTLKFFH